MIRQVFAFNRDIVEAKQWDTLPLDQRTWLQSRLCEEARELLLASGKVDQVDALLDSIYYAIGGLYRLGLTVEQVEDCFDIVHNANMSKQRGVRDKGVQNKNGDDAVKPNGWQPPESLIEEVLNEDKQNGYRLYTLG